MRRLIYDIIPPNAYIRYSITKFFNNSQRWGCITPDGKNAVILVYNETAPEKSYILKERM